MVKNMLLAHNVHASSSADAVSTFDVRFLINGMRPENYSFFWVLGITTKTFRVATEILSDVVSEKSWRQEWEPGKPQG